MDDTQLSIKDAGTILSAAVGIGEKTVELHERRKGLLLVFAEMIKADCGFWAWGRGRPDTSGVFPVAQIIFGMSHDQHAVIMQMGFDVELDREFRLRVFQRQGDTGCITTITEDIYSSEEWANGTFMRRFIEKGGWSTWLMGLRYGSRDTWSSMLLFRNEGQEGFSRRDAAVAQLMHEYVPWMHATAEETIPPEELAGLTPRQRAVMNMLLDGKSRKEIASKLKISEDTVGDHIKAVYAHFDVSSAAQLAARFLRSV